jgi:tRNA_anti-like
VRIQDRATHAWGALGVALALAFGIPSLIAIGHYKGTPWWAVPGLVVAAIFFLAALFFFVAPWLAKRASRAEPAPRPGDDPPAQKAPPDQEANTFAPPASPEPSHPPALRSSRADVPENTSGNETARSEPRVMCPLSPKELTRLFSQGATELQGESLVAQYKGQWRQVSATVEQVTRQNEYVISVNGKDSEQVSVTFFFKPAQWAARLQGLMRGDPVSAIGQVDLVNQSHVIFNHCELGLGG